ncbi:MAG: hypothetical protein VX670_11970, partial [Candidatus Latescibacterota bacterium]|nr:hypothetical protein [Candidatus Latescibacterota bacterium]
YFANMSRCEALEKVLGCCCKGFPARSAGKFFYGIFAKISRREAPEQFYGILPRFPGAKRRGF